MKKSVIAKCRVLGFHYWKNAPERYKYLKSNHRHEFIIYAIKEVSHNDREIEINDLQESIERWIKEHYGTVCNFNGMSCEDISELLIKQFNLSKCIVLEDGSCGAVCEVE